MNTQPKMRSCPVGRCDGGGLLFDEQDNTSYDCPCRPQLVAHNRGRALQSTIPARYRDGAFDRAPVTNIDPGVVQAIRRFCTQIGDRLDQGDGIRLTGPVGTGKTTLAMLICQAAITAGRSVAIYSLPGLLNEIRDTFGEDGANRHRRLLDRLNAVDLLHLDDVGAERQTDWALEELYVIVNSRYEQQKSITLTTNVSDHELREQVGERTASRLIEMCEQHQLVGDDMRSEVLG